MGEAKKIRVLPISSKDAGGIIQGLHYSHKALNNSQLHLGVFLGDRCGGAMQFGPPIDKRKLLHLVSDTPWNGFLELNRLALADWLPRNGESRALGYALRWIRKQYPHVQWIVSFADATQCDDGTIYRASGFVLTGITKNRTLLKMPDGRVVSELYLKLNPRMLAKLNGKVSGKKLAEAHGATYLPGFQLRYMYFLDPTARDRLTTPILPFSDIDKAGAGMYKGKPRAQSKDGVAPGTPAGRGRSDSDLCAPSRKE